MHYRFITKATEENLYNFNIFFTVKTSAARKRLLLYRIIFAGLILAYALAELWGESFSIATALSVIPCVLVAAVFCFGFVPLVKLTTKGMIKNGMKKGTIPTAHESVMEFYDDYFTDDSGEIRHEIKYSAITEVYVLPDEGIYLHKNNATNFIIPALSFETDKEWLSFVEFIRTKCDKVTMV